MRNAWFPQRIAEYVTFVEQKDILARNIAVERDFDFAATEPSKQTKAKEAQEPIPSPIITQLGREPSRATVPAPRAVEVERISVSLTDELVDNEC